MKITKSYLKQVIKEELQKLHETAIKEAVGEPQDLESRKATLIKGLESAKNKVAATDEFGKLFHNIFNDTIKAVQAAKTEEQYKIAASTFGTIAFQLDKSRRQYMPVAK